MCVPEFLINRNFESPSTFADYNALIYHLYFFFLPKKDATILLHVFIMLIVFTLEYTLLISTFKLFFYYKVNHSLIFMI